jgi:hypothetical protein
MVLRRLVVALAVAAAFPARALAVERGVILDPASPVGKEYSLPLDAQRVQLSGLTRQAIRAGAVQVGIAAAGSATAPGPAFGLGLTGLQRPGALRKASGGSAALTSQGTFAAALPPAERAALLAAGRVAARVPDGQAFGWSGALAAAAVLLAGLVGGAALRRLRVV